MDNGKGGANYMPIVYDKLFDKLKEKGYTTYKIRQDKLIGQGTLTAIKNGTGGLDAKTIARLCEVLDVAPRPLRGHCADEVCQGAQRRRPVKQMLSLTKKRRIETDQNTTKKPLFC